MLPSETVSEALEAAVLEWKQAEPEEVTGYTVSIREQFHEAWRQSGHEMRLVNRKRVNWTGRIPPMTTNSREETLRAWAIDAGRRLVRAGETLATRQTLSGLEHGNVAP